MPFELGANHGNHLPVHPPLNLPTIPAHVPLSDEVKLTLDRVGAKCVHISTSTSPSFARLVPLVPIHSQDLETISENLYKPRLGSFPMQVAKYLAERYNLQTVAFQKAPGSFDPKSGARLPVEFSLVVVLQGTAEGQAAPPSAATEVEYADLIDCIYLSLSFLCVLMNTNSGLKIAVSGKSSCEQLYLNRTNFESDIYQNFQ